MYNRRKEIIVMNIIVLFIMGISVIFLVLGGCAKKKEVSLPNGKYKIESFSVAKPFNGETGKLYIIVSDKEGIFHYLPIEKNIRKENTQELSVGNYLYMNNNEGIIKK